jgi:hypothetical protein
VTSTSPVPTGITDSLRPTHSETRPRTSTAATMIVELNARPACTATPAGGRGASAAKTTAPVSSPATATRPSSVCTEAGIQ